MAWFRNLKTMMKLMLGFGLVGAITAGIGYVGLANMANINEKVRNLYETQIIPLGYLSELRENITQRRMTLVILALGKDEAATRQALEKLREQNQEIDALEKKFEATIRTADVRETYTKYQETTKAYATLRDERVVKAVLAGKKDEAWAVMTKEGAPVFAAMLEGIHQTVARKEAQSKSRFEESQTVYTASRALVVAFVLGGILLGLALGYFIARLVAQALRQVVTAVEQIAAGDLTVRVGLKSRDELGQTGQALNRMVESFHDSMAQVQQAANSTSSASQQLAAGSEQLSSGAQEQASSLEETAASLEEMTATVKQNAENAQQATQMASASRSAAEQGGAIVKDAVGAMEQITASAKQIAAIITTIDEIAFQTNLLALNAAVEAARAGEQGRGFAVVASEVRALAQRAAASSKEIKTLITDSVSKIEEGAKLVNKSGDTLTEIVTGAKKVADLVAEISAASNEQSQGIEQVNKAVTQMDTITQQNAAQTEELSSTAQSLAAQAEELSAQVARFKLSAQGSSLGAGPAATTATVIPLKPRAKAAELKPVATATGTADATGRFEAF